MLINMINYFGIADKMLKDVATGTALITHKNGKGSVLFLKTDGILRVASAEQYVAYARVILYPFKKKMI